MSTFFTEDESIRLEREENGIPRRCSMNNECPRLWNDEYDCQECCNN